jgi:hypothetical protein
MVWRRNFSEGDNVPRRFAVFRRPLMSAAALVVVYGGALACGAATAGAATDSSQAAAWGVAQRIPGLDALAGALTGSGVDLQSVSCAAPGDCAAGGNYFGPLTDYGFSETAWVASEANGVWSPPVPIAIPHQEPGTHNVESVTSVSCASPGNCVAGGWDAEYVEYTGWVDTIGAFVVSEVNGVWGQPEQVPGTDTLNQGGYGLVTSVSCPAPGDCAVTGYVDGDHEFVDNETNGTWAAAELVPGYPGTPDSVYWEWPYILPAYPPVISCAGPGACVVAGNETSTWGAKVPSLATETGGIWGNAVSVRGFAAAGGAFTALSCTAPGECAAGGYASVGQNTLPLVADDVNGAWTTREVPGYAAISHAASGSPAVTSLSCAAPGDCAAGGTYQASGSDQGAFVDDEVNGSWQSAREIPGTKPVPLAVSVPGISCAAPGDCSAVIGAYEGNCAAADSFPLACGHVAVADEASGTWAPADPIAGTAGAADVPAISCAAPGACLAGGGDNGAADGYVVEKSASAATSARISLSAAKVTYGDEEAEKVTVTVTATTPAPAGKVTVAAAKSTACVLILTSGTGTCALSPAEFARGTVSLTASYGGGPGYASSSAVASLTVVKANTATALRLSASHVPYGQEQREKLTVRVSPRYAGRPSGTVRIRWRGVTVCVITLSKDTGTCKLPAKLLAPGTRNLVAAYQGNADFNGSSAEKPLTITG